MKDIILIKLLLLKRPLLERITFYTILTSAIILLILSFINPNSNTYKAINLIFEFGMAFYIGYFYGFRDSVNMIENQLKDHI